MAVMLSGGIEVAVDDAADGQGIGAGQQRDDDHAGAYRSPWAGGSHADVGKAGRPPGRGGQRGGQRQHKHSGIHRAYQQIVRACNLPGRVA